MSPKMQFPASKIKSENGASKSIYSSRQQSYVDSDLEYLSLQDTVWFPGDE